MKWYHPLQVGESVRDSKRKVIRKIKKCSPFTGAYLICLPSNSQNLLDLIPARELAQKDYPKENLRVIGIAGSKDEAIEMVSELVVRTLKAQNNTDVYSYLKGQWRR